MSHSEVGIEPLKINVDIAEFTRQLEDVEEKWLQELQIYAIKICKVSM